MLSKGGTSRNKRNKAQNAGGAKRAQAKSPESPNPSGGGRGSRRDRSEIYSLVTSTDLALLATLIHDAIGHLMNAIDKAAKVQEPIDRIADAMEATAANIKNVARSQRRRLWQRPSRKARAR